MKCGSARCSSVHSPGEHFPSTAPQAFCTACPAYLGTVSHALLAISMGVSHHSIHQTCSSSSYRHNSPASVTILQQFKMAKLSPSQSKCHASRCQPYKKTDARMGKAGHDHARSTTSTLSRKGLVRLERVRKELGTKTNIVIISGAGISTNAGGKFYSICSF
jgi:hypothetical protein